jgi:hypothetical protein
MSWCRYPIDRVPLYTSFKSRQLERRTPTHSHVSYSTGLCLSVEVGSGAITCHALPDSASQLRRAPVRHMSYNSGSCLPARDGSEAPRVLQLRILPPCSGGLRCVTCPTALNHTSLQRRALERRVSYGSRPYLPTGRAPVPPPHALRFPVDRGPQIYK